MFQPILGSMLPALVRHSLLLVVVTGLSACVCGDGRGPSPHTRSSHPIRVKDDRGSVVALPRPARRIASLSPSNTEILFAIGCGDHVVLRDRVSSYPAAARRLPATNPFQVSPGHIAGFNPDLVLLSHGDSSRIAALRQLGLAVAIFEPKTLDAVGANIRAIGKLCGAPDRAAKLAASFRRRVREAAVSVKGRPRPTVFIETDGTDPLKPWTAGAGSFVDRLVQLAGGENIAGKLERPYAQVSAEEVLLRNPDLILLMSPDESRVGRIGGLARLRARPGWRDLPAVRKGRVIDHINPDLLSRPGPRLADGLEALVKALHGSPSSGQVRR